MSQVNIPAPMFFLFHLTIILSHRHEEALVIFVSSMQNFRNSLSETDARNFHNFDNPELMIEDIAQRCRDRRLNSKVLGCCQAIKGFADKMLPFFEVIDIFIQSHPDWAGLAWGAVRLVFLVLRSSMTPPFLALPANKLLVMWELCNLSRQAYWDVYVNLSKTACV